MTDKVMGGQSHTAGPYLLMKRGLYYRPGAMGYTGIRDNAGRYTEAEAKDNADPVPGVVPVLLAEAPEFSPRCYDDLALAHVLKQRDALVEALTPSGDTKAAYHGEFKFQLTQWREDDEGEAEEYLADIVVPWTTVKEIMAAIHDRAKATGESAA